METKSTRVYYLIRFVLWCSENIISLIGKLYLQAVARARYYDNNIAHHVILIIHAVSLSRAPLHHWLLGA